MSSSARTSLVFTYRETLTEEGCEICLKTDDNTALIIHKILSTLKNPFPCKRFGQSGRSGDPACYMYFSFLESESFKKRLLIIALDHLKKGSSFKCIEKELEEALDFDNALSAQFQKMLKEQEEKLAAIEAKSKEPAPKIPEKSSTPQALPEPDKTLLPIQQPKSSFEGTRKKSIVLPLSLLRYQGIKHNTPEVLPSRGTNSLNPK